MIVDAILVWTLYAFAFVVLVGKTAEMFFDENNKGDDK